MIEQNLSCVVWKYLTGEELIWEDFKQLDLHVINYIESIEQMPQNDLQYCDQEFVCTLSDGQEKLLINNGKEIMLNTTNKYQFLKLYKECRQNEFNLQLKEIKRGFCKCIYESELKYYSWTSLEEKLTGSPGVDLNFLKSITQYSGFEKTDQTIKWFWTILESFTTTDLEDFLKFLCGRSRINKADRENNMTITKMWDDDKFGSLPHAHTCFFELELPNYSSYKDMRQKMLYGIRNCKDMGGEEGSMSWVSDNENEDWD